MRVERGVPNPTHDEYGDASLTPAPGVVRKSSAAGDGGEKRAAGLAEEAVADEDDDEDNV